MMSSTVSRARGLTLLCAAIAACSSSEGGAVAAPAAAASATPDAGVAPPSEGPKPITYTIEPYDFDGLPGISFNVTQMQLHGSLCPCMKIPYIADGLHNQEGADAIWKAVQKGIFKPGDNLMGFSLGSQVISLFLAQHALPPGVRVILLGDTFARNDVLVAQKAGVPADIANPVLLIANQYDGWSDYPTESGALGYSIAVQNATSGMSRLHNYVYARLDHPSSVVNVRGNITAIRIPTQQLPLNYRSRDGGASSEGLQRMIIDGAYAPEVVPTREQIEAATDVQVGPEGSDLTGLPQSPEPVVDLE